MQGGGTGATVESEFLVAPPEADLRRFKPELMPAWISVASLVAGQPGFAATDPIRAAFIGGGTTFTPAVAAAVHPGSNFWWWDPTLTGADHARRLQQAADLTNLRVHEKPDLLGDLGEELGGPLDLMVVDGVVDATADQRWHGLIDTIATSLRPGGTVCVSYRTQVGWAEIQPVHHLVNHLLSRDPRPARDAVADVRSTLRHLHANGAAYLTQRPVVSAWIDQITGLSDADLLSRVAGHDLRPTSHARLVERLGPLGCVYVGPARAADLAGATLSDDLATIVEGSASPLVKEVLTDLALRRSHRVDIFRLGEAVLSTTERHKRIDALEITGQTKIDPADRSLRAIAKVATLRALAAGPVTVKDLAAKAPERESMLVKLLAAGAVHPTLPASAERAAGDGTGDADSRPEAGGRARGRANAGAAGAVARLNAVVSKPPVAARDRVLASPVLASALAAASKPDRAQREALGIR